MSNPSISYTGNCLLVQALLCADGQHCHPYLIWRDAADRVQIQLLENEVASTVFVNGCVALCASTDAIGVIDEAMQGAASVAEAIQKIDTALRHHAMYAPAGANDYVAVLAPLGRKASVI